MIPTPDWCRSSAFAVAVVTGASCRSPEHELVDRYLEASRREDNATVAALSMVGFPEEITDWEVLAIGEERREPYRVPALRENVELAEDRRDEQFQAFGDFRQENYDNLASIQRRLRDDPGAQLEGALGELQKAWDAFREERRAVVTRLHEAEQELEWEIRKVNKSLQRESSPEYLTGETLLEEAEVRVVTGRGEAVYRMTLTRYDLKNQFGAVVPSRWIVTEVAEARDEGS